MVSHDNLTDINKASIKYISALDKDQISNIAGILLDEFHSLDENNPGPKLNELRFKKYDKCLYYKDLGIIESRRYILGLNPELLKQERTLRAKLLDEVDIALNDLNTSLMNALKSRKEQPTGKKVEKILKEKNSKQFIEWELRPLTIEINKKKNGINKKCNVSTFQVNWTRRPSKISKRSLLDGALLFVSNHRERRGKGYAIKAETMISAYRNKNEVEDAFRILKSFLDFRPVYVYLDDHVRAHYTICVLSYLLNVTVRNHIRNSKTIKNCHAHDIYSKLGECYLGELGVNDIEGSVKTIREPNEIHKNILKEFGYESLMKKSFLKKVLSTSETELT